MWNYIFKERIYFENKLQKEYYSVLIFEIYLKNQSHIKILFRIQTQSIRVCQFLVRKRDRGIIIRSSYPEKTQHRDRQCERMRRKSEEKDGTDENKVSGVAQWNMRGKGTLLTVKTSFFFRSRIGEAAHNK